MSQLMVIGEEEQDCIDQLYVGRATVASPGAYSEADMYSHFGSLFFPACMILCSQATFAGYLLHFF